MPHSAEPVDNSPQAALQEPESAEVSFRQTVHLVAEDLKKRLTHYLSKELVGRAISAERRERAEKLLAVVDTVLIGHRSKRLASNDYHAFMTLLKSFYEQHELDRHFYDHSNRFGACLSHPLGLFANCSVTLDPQQKFSLNISKGIIERSKHWESDDPYAQIIQQQRLSRFETLKRDFIASLMVVKDAKEIERLYSDFKRSFNEATSEGVTRLLTDCAVLCEIHRRLLKDEKLTEPGAQLSKSALLPDFFNALEAGKIFSVLQILFQQGYSRAQIQALLPYLVRYQRMEIISGHNPTEEYVYTEISHLLKQPLFEELIVSGYFRKCIQIDPDSAYAELSFLNGINAQNLFSIEHSRELSTAPSVYLTLKCNLPRGESQTVLNHTQAEELGRCVPESTALSSNPKWKTLVLRSLLAFVSQAALEEMLAPNSPWRFSFDSYTDEAKAPESAAVSGTDVSAQKAPKKRSLSEIFNELCARNSANYFFHPLLRKEFAWNRDYSEYNKVKGREFDLYHRVLEHKFKVNDAKIRSHMLNVLCQRAVGFFFGSLNTIRKFFASILVEKDPDIMLTCDQESDFDLKTDGKFSKLSFSGRLIESIMDKESHAAVKMPVAVVHIEVQFNLEDPNALPALSRCDIEVIEPQLAQEVKQLLASSTDCIELLAFSAEDENDFKKLYADELEESKKHYATLVRGNFVAWLTKPTKENEPTEVFVKIDNRLNYKGLNENRRPAALADIKTRAHDEIKKYYELLQPLLAGHERVVVENNDQAKAVDDYLSAIANYAPFISVVIQSESNIRQLAEPLEQVKKAVDYLKSYISLGPTTSTGRSVLQRVTYKTVNTLRTHLDTCLASNNKDKLSKQQECCASLLQCIVQAVYSKFELGGLSDSDCKTFMTVCYEFYVHYLKDSRLRLWWGDNSLLDRVFSKQSFPNHFQSLIVSSDLFESSELKFAILSNLSKARKARQSSAEPVSDYEKLIVKRLIQNTDDLLKLIYKQPNEAAVTDLLEVLAHIPVSQQARKELRMACRLRIFMLQPCHQLASEQAFIAQVKLLRESKFEACLSQARAVVQAQKKQYAENVLDYLRSVPKNIEILVAKVFPADRTEASNQNDKLLDEFCRQELFVSEVLDDIFRNLLNTVLQFSNNIQESAFKSIVESVRGILTGLQCIEDIFRGATQPPYVVHQVALIKQQLEANKSFIMKAYTGERDRCLKSLLEEGKTMESAYELQFMYHEYKQLMSSEESESFYKPISDKFFNPEDEKDLTTTENVARLQERVKSVDQKEARKINISFANNSFLTFSRLCSPKKPTQDIISSPVPQRQQ